MSEVENIRHIFNKNVASYTRASIAPKAKKGGAQAFLDLTVPYIYHILLYREVDQALWSPLAKPLIIHIDGIVILSVQRNQFQQTCERTFFHCVIPEEAENVCTHTMGGIICQTIPRPLKNV